MTSRITMALAGVALLALAGCNSMNEEPAAATTPPPPMPPSAAASDLQGGPSPAGDSDSMSGM